ncbi:MAG: hypothetical protein JXN59_04145 [Anaerolineae bacterium]|nr:hypothetical protein [Anaerolineae bacterium]
MATLLFALISWIIMTLLRLGGYFISIGILLPNAVDSLLLQLIPQFIVVGFYSYHLVKMFYLEKPRFWFAVGLLWTLFTIVFEIGGLHNMVDVSTYALANNLTMLAASPWALTYLIYSVAPVAAYLVFRNSRPRVQTPSF